MKRKLIHILPPLVAAILAVLGYSQLAGIEGVAFKFDVVYDGDMDELWAVLDTFPDGTVVRIIFRVNGVEMLHSPRMELMGGSSAAFDIGDQLPLSKSDGIWTEMTRYVKP